MSFTSFPFDARGQPNRMQSYEKKRYVRHQNHILPIFFSITRNLVSLQLDVAENVMPLEEMLGNAYIRYV